MSSPLAALTRAYERLRDRGLAPPYGYSQKKIGFLIPLAEAGEPAGPPIDLRDTSGRKPQPHLMAVPQPVKRTSGIAPNFLWDKSAYVLGVTAGPGKRAAKEHAAFVRRHQDALAGTDDPGLRALAAFLRDWRPEHFAARGWPEAMLDQNIVFALDSEHRARVLHERPAARALWENLCAEAEGRRAVCLVTGETRPIARLHPAIEGVWGGQSSGVSLVSFNQESFESYGRSQGDNAPVSDYAAFAYTTALNTFLSSGSRQRIQIGDASTVFWAEAPDPDIATLAEDLFSQAVEPGDTDDAAEAERVGTVLERIRQGIALPEINPALAKGVRFFVLGLAPNAARVSIRFWLEDEFGRLAHHLYRWAADTRIEPPPHPAYPSLWRFLVETAAQGKSENMPPNLAGEVLRALLTGGPLPQTLLATLLMRIRADSSVSPLRVALLKALLIRNYPQADKEIPVALDPSVTEPGYLLGRLFALYEKIQIEALGGNLNATIKDKFYGSASTQPARVFPALDRGSVNHLAKIGKDNPGRRVTLDKLLGEIFAPLGSDGDPFPPALPPRQQGLFSLGYYHQRSDFFRKKDTAEKETAA